MARKRKKSKRWLAPVRWWTLLDADFRRRALVGGALLSAVVGCLLAAGYGLGRLDDHVRDMMLQQHPSAEVTFVDLPQDLAELALQDLHATVADLQSMRWTDDELCRATAERLQAVGWIEHLNFVRRANDAVIQISADYRYPVAMVQQNTEFFMVDAQGVRLPGSYRYDPTWRLIQGTAAPAPPAGALWPGEDIQAGLAVLSRIVSERFAHQITGVLVENFGGRLDRFGTHIALATDRSGGRIAWGSAVGHEVEENSVAQKIALLRANYRDSGRVDADHAVIDVSTFPDRISIPG